MGKSFMANEQADNAIKGPSEVQSAVESRTKIDITGTSNMELKLSSYVIQALAENWAKLNLQALKDSNAAIQAPDCAESIIGLGDLVELHKNTLSNMYKHSEISLDFIKLLCYTVKDTDTLNVIYSENLE